MTPEEAKPHCAGAAHNALLDQDCGGEPFPPWFTAKETAEIAKAYAESYRQCDLYCVGVCEQRPDCVNKFDKNLEEWSK